MYVAIVMSSVVPTTTQALTSRCGQMVYVSGHLPLPTGGELIRGKVGKDLTAEEAKEAAKWVGMNLLATLKEVAGDLDKVKVHKLVGFVNCVDDFHGQPGVVNGCSDLMVAVLGEVRSWLRREKRRVVRRRPAATRARPWAPTRCP